MKILTKYLTKEIYGVTSATALILLLIFLSNQVVRFMNAAAYGFLASNAIATIILLQLPILTALILPAALFLGILLAYGRLYADSEMTVLEICGIGPQKLLSITLTYSALVMILVAMLSLWINPKVYSYIDSLLAGVSRSSLEMIKPKHFNEISDGSWVLYVNSVADDRKHFFDVFAAQRMDHGHKKGKSSSLIARQAYHRNDVSNNGDSYIVLVDGHRYFGKPGQRDYEVIKFKEYGIKIREKEKIWQANENSMSTYTLWQKRKEPRAAAELQWRISLPLLALILVLIATPLSKIPPKKGRYFKLAPAILIYILYANFLFLAKAWIKKGTLAPTLGIWWVHGLMFMIAIFLFVKQRGWSKIYKK